MGSWQLCGNVITLTFNMHNYSWFMKSKTTGCPKKTLVSVQRLLEASKSELQMKVGWVLKNSGNFQSNEHRSFVFLPKNAWDIDAQSWLPSPLNAEPNLSSWNIFWKKGFFTHILSICVVLIQARCSSFWELNFTPESTKKCYL